MVRCVLGSEPESLAKCPGAQSRRFSGAASWFVWLIFNKMTSFSQAKEKGLHWPRGPDDLAPSKIENPYLYAGGFTTKGRILLAEVYVGWYASIIALDRYLYKRRAQRASNRFLEMFCAHSATYFFHSALAVWIAYPVSQFMYWNILDLAVGVKPKARNPLPLWKAGEEPHH